MTKPQNFRLVIILSALLALLLVVIGQWSGGIMVGLLTLLLPYVRRLAESAERTEGLLREVVDGLRAAPEEA